MPIEFNTEREFAIQEDLNDPEFRVLTKSAQEISEFKFD